MGVCQINEQLHLSDVDAAWLAALIDGEGSIYTTSKKGAGGRPIFMVGLSIANTSVPLLSRASELMPGSRTYRAHGGVNRAVYAVRLQCGRAVDVMQCVRPWLIAKANQADLAIELQSTQRKGHVHDEPMIAYKERLSGAISAANHHLAIDLPTLLASRPAA